MFTVIYYIFAVLIIGAAFYIAFGKSTINSAFSFFLLMIAVCGIFVMVNAELFALINILALFAIVSILLILFPGIGNLKDNEVEALPNSHLVSITVLALLTALITSLVSSTRWQLFEINYEINSLILIFTQYLPLILLIALAASVVIASIPLLLKKGRA